MVHQHLAIKGARVAILTAAASAATSVSAEHWKNVGEFEDASIRVERNATDGDTEIVVTAKPLSDLGLKTFSVLSPHWRRVVDVDSPPRSRGVREFLFESPEPPDSQILAHYPEGDYLYFGVATNGQWFVGSAELSHELPSATSIVFPAEGQVLPIGPLTIRWAAVPDAAQYIVEVENESARPERSLSVNLPAGNTSFAVPAGLIAPGSDYQVGVATVAENGNIVFVEAAFSTGD